MRLPRMDMHLHTRLSDGQATLEQVVQQALLHRLDYVSLTDHLDADDPAPYRRGPAPADYHAAGRYLGEQFAGAGTRFCFGAETCLTADFCRLNLPPEVSAELDFVVGSVHYVRAGDHTPVPGDYFDPVYWEAYKQEIMALLRTPGVTTLGHIEGYMPLSPLLLPDSTFEQRREIEREIAMRLFTPAWQEQVAAAAAANGVAVEIHVATRTPRPEFVRVLLAHGVRLTVGTDAHVPDQIGEIGWALDMLAQVGAKPDDLWQPGR